MKEIKIHKQGFTLIEMLVVVLIIGILASVALPQYQMAVTKAKVASILPLMRRWKDALTEYKLQHGNYEDENGERPDGATLGVNWPSDWKTSTNELCGDDIECENDYWHCFANEESTGYVYCDHNNNNDLYFEIIMYQSDDPNYENYRDKIICFAGIDEGHKICKALGGKLPEGGEDEYILN